MHDRSFIFLWYILLWTFPMNIRFFCKPLTFSYHGSCLINMIGFNSWCARHLLHAFSATRKCIRFVSCTKIRSIAIKREKTTTISMSPLSRRVFNENYYCKQQTKTCIKTSSILTSSSCTDLVQIIKYCNRSNSKIHDKKCIQNKTKPILWWHSWCQLDEYIFFMNIYRNIRSQCVLLFS